MNNMFMLLTSFLVSSELEFSKKGDEQDSSNQVLSNQRLTQQEILGLMEDGTSGDKIVKALVEGNTTFGEKTAFSKEKYLRKKIGK
jgi:hypothetical protein